MALENISLTLALAVYVCLYIPDCRTLRNTWKAIWLPSAIAGLMMSGAYGLVLLAMAYVRNVSFISAFRQLSIPIGAVMGIVFRKESRPWPKLFGIVLILLGLVVVTLSKY
jgi:drug/metabolite transporter (DMT)-like permease